ncbi:MAG: helix-turn-helix transcriptional regulator [Oscillospiraceae bacterium]|nr:helix-turn-helix domain-containing protein [Oscillospiraceae bacterium]MDD7042358.1 helix-turn-helix transcriptional regulator [Oscillospiraceae bacterium]MDY2610496.1 helix-turn-helix transcriptional regulator [Oscillospiraceae bacterium]
MRMLRTIRKEKGLTMKQLGAIVGVTEAAISQYETGKREADFETLLKISEALECTVDYLLGREQEKEKNHHQKGDGFTKKELELIQKFRAAKKEDQDLLLANATILAQRNQADK